MSGPHRMYPGGTVKSLFRLFGSVAYSECDSRPKSPPGTSVVPPKATVQGRQNSIENRMFRVDQIALSD